MALVAVASAALPSYLRSGNPSGAALNPAAAAAPSPSSSSSSLWDETEILIKGSDVPSERPMIKAWVESYLASMRATSFPRLHVIADDVSPIQELYSHIPNVTFHNISYPEAVKDVYYRIQWPMLVADLWTSAKHVLVLDNDTPLLVPLRCHHVMDATERPLWHSWRWSDPLSWTRNHERLFEALGEPVPLRPGHDFMTFFPVPIPRSLLSKARRVAIEAASKLYIPHSPKVEEWLRARNDTASALEVETAAVAEGRRAAEKTQASPAVREMLELEIAAFGDAWAALPKPSYADHLAKTALVYQPEAIRWVYCPSKPLNSECLHRISVTEHVKHPQQGAHNRATVRHMSQEAAVNLSVRLQAEAANFTRGVGPMPHEMWHYAPDLVPRSEGLVRALGERLLRPDAPGRVCGSRAELIDTDRALKVEL